MGTTPPANTPSTEQWSTKSKKRMILGLVVILVGIGTEPFFQALQGITGLFFSIIIIFLGFYLACLGYREK